MIYRKHRDLNNEEISVLEDMSLSWTAKGIYVVLSRMDNGYEFGIKDIAKYGSGETEGELTNALDELLARGFIECELGGVFVSEELLHRKDISHFDRYVLIGIKMFSTDSIVSLSNEAIAEKLNISKGSVANSLTKIRNLGLIETVLFDGRKRQIKLLY